MFSHLAVTTKTTPLSSVILLRHAPQPACKQSLSCPGEESSCLGCSWSGKDFSSCIIACALIAVRFGRTTLDWVQNSNDTNQENNPIHFCKWMVTQ